MESLYQITRDKLPTPDEVDALLTYCARQAKIDLANGRKVWVTRYLLAHLACGGGLRASEIALLRVADFERAAGKPLLWARRAGGQRHRSVHLGPGLAGHLLDYLATRRAAWGDFLGAEDLVLPGRNGRPYSTAALCFSFRRAVEAAGLSTPFSLRNARHFYAAFLLAKTEDLCYVQRQMGHANQSMTTLYLDVAPFLDHRQAQAAIW